VLRPSHLFEAANNWSVRSRWWLRRFGFRGSFCGFVDSSYGRRRLKTDSVTNLSRRSKSPRFGWNFPTRKSPTVTCGTHCEVSVSELAQQFGCAAVPTYFFYFQRRLVARLNFLVGSRAVRPSFRRPRRWLEFEPLHFGVNQHREKFSEYSPLRRRGPIIGCLSEVWSRAAVVIAWIVVGGHRGRRTALRRLRSRFADRPALESVFTQHKIDAVRFAAEASSPSPSETQYFLRPNVARCEFARCRHRNGVRKFFSFPLPHVCEAGNGHARHPKAHQPFGKSKLVFEQTGGLQGLHRTTMQSSAISTPPELQGAASIIAGNHLFA